MEFDDMVQGWNEDHEDQKNEISAYAFPNGRGCQTKYDLSRERVYLNVRVSSLSNLADIC
jgi:hypothetical protein